jgi:hypothetical protein
MEWPGPTLTVEISKYKALVDCSGCGFTFLLALAPYGVDEDR